MSLEAFGPNLRRLRTQRGITLEQIVTRTKLPRALFDGLESNNFSRWPGGIYARAFVRQYALAIGEDPESTVDEFCRWFEVGDRRAERIVREQAQIVGHQLAWKDDIPALADSRHDGAAPRPVSRPDRSLLVRLRRALGKA